jgi:hypothetical protein
MLGATKLPLDRYVGDDAAAEILRWAGDSEAAVQIKREMVATGRAGDNVVEGDVLDGRVSGLVQRERGLRFRR